MKKNLILLFTLVACIVNAQEPPARKVTDISKGCSVLLKHTFQDDSITWSGGCKNGFADGYGKMIGFTKGTQTSTYIGFMQHGKPHGKGVYTFWGNRKLEGNFSSGEPLFLEENLISKVSKNIVSTNDPDQVYVGDNNESALYYHAIIPDKINGTVVLMPGTWETTEHAISSMQNFCELAYKNHLAVLVLSINQRLTLTDTILTLMNSMFSDAIKKYNLPKQSFVLGGWSMGGLFSLRYTALANQFPAKTVIKPVAVFSCDGPCDLISIYNNFQRKLNKNPSQNEPAYGINEMRKYCGGSPDEALNKYIYYSVYNNVDSGGNAKYLLQTPVRIYADVDPVWWMQNRRVDMYDLNALDQTAMIQKLRDLGNQQAEFINAYQKGVRLEGNRHPHSWSIIEPNEAIAWILNVLNKP